MPEDRVIVYTGSDEQPLQDQIKIGGRPFNIGASTVKFRMREAQGTTLKVDAAAVVDDATQGRVSYAWNDLDLNTPGEYYGWWHIIITGGEIDTDEFLVIVAEHAPGLRTRTGSIYRTARGILPVTFYALETSDKYGDALLQEKIEVAKMRVFGVQILVENEGNYDVRVVDFVAKVAALEIIPGAVDYWMNQHQTITTQGTQEVVSYPDRIAALWKIYERLTIEVAKEKPIIEEILGTMGELVPAIHTPKWSEGTEVGFMTPLTSRFFEYDDFDDTTGFW